MPPHPPSPSVRLRPATQADIPRLANIFVRAFRPSPWSAVLFPPHLRSSSSVSKRENNGHDNPKVSDDDNIDDYKDELNWRERLFTADLAKPGRRCILAVQSTVPATESTTEGRDDGGRPVIAEMQRENGNGAQEETILGWASWVDEPIYAPSNASSSSTSSTVPGPQEPTAEQIAAERERTWGSLHPPGLDVVAFEDLSKKGKGVEAFAKKALVGEGGGWVDAVGEFCFVFLISMSFGLFFLVNFHNISFSSRFFFFTVFGFSSWFFMAISHSYPKKISLHPMSRNLNTLHHCLRICTGK